MTLVQNVFYLITPSRTFTFMGKDPDEKEDWMVDLNRCIKGASGSSNNSSNGGGAVVAEGDRLMRMDVTILGSEVRVDPKTKKSFTVYRLHVLNEATGAENSDVWRRYSEFDKLKKGIRKAFPAIDFANLPRKHIVGNLNNDVIEARRIMLERYLQEIIMNPVVLGSDLVRSFLDADKLGVPRNK
jgi:hypothetical protein